MVPRPTRYFIQYQDPRKWTLELQEHHIEDTLTEEDARTLEAARLLGRHRAANYQTHVGIYERTRFEQVEPPYGPWHFDEVFIGSAEVDCEVAL